MRPVIRELRPSYLLGLTKAYRYGVLHTRVSRSNLPRSTVSTTAHPGPLGAIATGTYPPLSVTTRKVAR